MLNQENPIYILGNNPLAHYLYAKLSACGEDVFLLGKQNGAKNIFVKDCMFAKKYEVKVASAMQPNAKMLIITSSSEELNSAIVNLSSQKIGSTPIVLFAMLKNIEHLRDILGRNIYCAFFDGFLEEQNNKIDINSYKPSLSIHANTEVAFDNNVVKTFVKSGIKTSACTNHKKLFWQNFIPYAALSLSSAYNNKKTLFMLANKTQNDELKKTMEELCLIAQKDGVELNHEELYKNLYQTPENYVFPLHTAVEQKKYADLNNLSNTIKAHADCPQLCKMLKNLYEKVL